MKPSAVVFVGVLSLLVASGLCDPSYFRNVDYLGSGYDVISGDPQATGRLDPGIKEPVIKMSYNKGQTTADHRYFIPDGCTALPRLSCSYSSQVTQVATTQEYAKTKTLDVKVGVAWENISFSASYGTSKTVTTMQKKESKYCFAKGLCVVYRATISLYSPVGTLDLSDNFRGMVTNGLAERLDDEDLFFQFLDLFGTHVLVQIDFGAKTVVQSEFTKEAWSKTTESSRTIGASASFAVFTASVSSTEQKKAAESFEEARASFENHVIGALPTDTGGDFYQWAARADQDPVPVQYKLIEIGELLTAQYFPDVPQIVAVKAKVDAALRKYCDHKQGCFALY